MVNDLFSVYIIFSDFGGFSLFCCSWDVGFTLGIIFFVCSSHDIIFINYDSDDAVVCKPWEGEFRGR